MELGLGVGLHNNCTFELTVTYRNTFTKQKSHYGKV